MNTFLLTLGISVIMINGHQLVLGTEFKGIVNYWNYPSLSILGVYISFSGILTFKKSEALREIAASVPLDRLLVETDAPFLAPGKHRGKRNEPAYVVETAKELARVKGISAAELARITTENFFRLYAKVPRTAANAVSGS